VVNGDFTALDDEEHETVLKGMEALPERLVPDFDSETNEGVKEFARMPCECCGSTLAGGRHRFAVLGEGEE
jgi:hypothetical protein